MRCLKFENQGNPVNQRESHRGRHDCLRGRKRIFGKSPEVAQSRTGVNAISKVLNKLQVFHFCSIVHTNTTPTVITHSCVLQIPPFCNNNGYKFELKS